MSTPSRYPVPQGRARVEDRVRHSRFIATIGPAPTVDAARALIDSVRAEFPDATHHCYAFVVGPPGTTRNAGSSDAGEPAGTAGRPMLSVLVNSGVGDVAVVVTRYFGGVKLGKGGLVRAYSGSVQHALRVVETGEHVETVTWRVTVPYALADAARRAAEHEGAVVSDQAYDRDVRLTLDIPDDRTDAVERAVMDATSGAARIEP